MCYRHVCDVKRPRDNCSGKKLQKLQQLLESLSRLVSIALLWLAFTRCNPKQDHKVYIKKLHHHHNHHHTLVLLLCKLVNMACTCKSVCVCVCVCVCVLVFVCMVTITHKKFYLSNHHGKQNNPFSQTLSLHTFSFCKKKKKVQKQEQVGKEERYPPYPNTHPPSPPPTLSHTKCFKTLCCSFKLRIWLHRCIFSSLPP